MGSESVLPTVNRQWILQQRPRGDIDDQTFAVNQQAIPPLAEGDVLLRVLYLSFDPAQRPWMDDVPSYLPPVQLGEPMRASAVGQVIASANDDFPVGTLMSGMFGWQEYVHCTAQSIGQFHTVPEGTPPTWPLSVFGGTSLTAYFGLLDVGKPSAGDTVVVSGAAGATGSVVCQIAKIKGCRVIGIAGGPEKCAWLKESCGIDEAIDYRSESIDQRLTELCPEGVNLFYDNVGGATLTTLINHMADHSTIVLCGAITSYNATKFEPGPPNLFRIITNRIRMEGFIVIDYLDQMDRFLTEFAPWVMEGKIAFREDIQEGFENIPATLKRLFASQNQGKQLLKLADPVK